MNDPPVLLIVDDEEEIRENLKDFAEFKGFTVREAGNGLEALDVLEAQRPHLVISDLKMPEMDGLEMLLEIARRGIQVPVVIMTAFGTMEYAINAMKNGAADFITKPIDLPYLMRVVERVLKRSEIEQKVKDQQRQLDEDIQHAAMIQRCLLPEPIDSPRLVVHYRYHPYIAIGGDYLTLHKYNDSRVAFALYDVSGHGVSAALTANLVHNQLQLRLAEHRPPSNIIDLLNRFITQHIGKTNMFVTMIIGMIDAEEGSLVVSNAGHPEMLLWHGERHELEGVSSHLPPVGFAPKILCDRNESRLEVASGDRIILFTDGLTEACNAEGVLAGLRGMKEWFGRYKELPVESFLDAMFSEVEQFRQGEADDDMTLMVLDVR